MAGLTWSMPPSPRGFLVFIYHLNLLKWKQALEFNSLNPDPPRQCYPEAPQAALLPKEQHPAALSSRGRLRPRTEGCKS